MRLQDNHPLKAWRRQHLELKDTSTWIKVERMLDVIEAFGNADTLIVNWELALDDNLGLDPEPVGLVALYGRALVLIEGWTELPIAVPKGEEQAWRDAGIGATYEEFYANYITRMAEQIIEIMTSEEPGKIHPIIRSELMFSYARLDKFIGKPIEWHVPDEPLNTHKWTGDKDYFWLYHGFDLLGDLILFRYALPLLRDMIITETSEELHLPNKQLHEELLLVDLSVVEQRINEYEPSLREIFDYLVAGGHMPEAKHEPNMLWWYHPKRLP